jgi:hypothetical protein
MKEIPVIGDAIVKAFGVEKEVDEYLAKRRKISKDDCRGQEKCRICEC